MKIKVSLVVTTFLLLTTQNAFAETIKINNNNTPVQVECNNPKVIYFLSKGTEVEKLSSSNQMYQIKYSLSSGENISGWISSSNIESQIDGTVLSSYGRIYDYIVKTDVAGALPPIRTWQELQKILDTYSGKNTTGSTGKYKLNQESVCKALIQAQEQYKINALYLASSAIWTCGGGRNMKYQNNILNIGTNTYSSVEECILAGGSLLERSYFPEGRVTIRTIRQKWNAGAGDKRAMDIARQIVIFYERGIQNGFIEDAKVINKFNEIWKNTSNQSRYL